MAHTHRWPTAEVEKRVERRTEEANRSREREYSWGVNVALMLGAGTALWPDHKGSHWAPRSGEPPRILNCVPSLWSQGKWPVFVKTHHMVNWRFMYFIVYKFDLKRDKRTINKYWTLKIFTWHVWSDGFWHLPFNSKCIQMKVVW